MFIFENPVVLHLARVTFTTAASGDTWSHGPIPSVFAIARFEMTLNTISRPWRRGERCWKSPGEHYNIIAVQSFSMTGFVMGQRWPWGEASTAFTGLTRAP